MRKLHVPAVLAASAALALPLVLGGGDHASAEPLPVDTTVAGNMKLGKADAENVPTGSTFAGTYDAASGAFAGKLDFPEQVIDSNIVVPAKATIEVVALSDLTGTVTGDTATGSVSLELQLKKATPTGGEEILLAPCNFGPIEVNFTGTLDAATKMLTLKDDALTVPPATQGCGGDVIRGIINGEVPGDGNISALSFSLLQAIPVPPGEYTPLQPARLLDTRMKDTEVTIDGKHQHTGRIQADTTYTLDVRNRGGVAADVDAVSLNVTAVFPSQAGFITAYPCDAERPGAANLNYAAGDPAMPRAVISKVSAAGTVCLYSLKETDLVVDVGGYFPVNSDLNSFAPKRIADSRPGEQTADGQSQGFGPIAAGQTTKIRLAGRLGMPAPGEVAGAVLSVAVDTPTDNGYIVAFPCASTPPDAANVNYPAGGAPVSNLVVAPVDANGDICLFNLGQTNLIVDVSATLGTDTRFTAITPQRLMETRGEFRTVDGKNQTTVKPAAAATTTVEIFGRGEDPTKPLVPTTAKAVILNITLVKPDAPLFITAYPCDEPMPLAAANNIVPTSPGPIPNAAIVKLPDDGSGKVCIYNLEPVDIVVDVMGYVNAPAA